MHSSAQHGLSYISWRSLYFLPAWNVKISLWYLPLFIYFRVSDVIRDFISWVSLSMILCINRRVKLVTLLGVGMGPSDTCVSCCPGTSQGYLPLSHHCSLLYFALTCWVTFTNILSFPFCQFLHSFSRANKVWAILSLSAVPFRLCHSDSSASNPSLPLHPLLSHQLTLLSSFVT